MILSLVISDALGRALDEAAGHAGLAPAALVVKLLKERLPVPARPGQPALVDRDMPAEAARKVAIAAQAQRLAERFPTRAAARETHADRLPNRLASHYRTQDDY